MTASETLYAVWTPTVVTYAVTFSANGGGGTMANETFTSGVPKALTANAFTRSSYTFAGWATSSGGPVVYSDGQSVTIGATETLFAIWTPTTSPTTTTVSENYSTRTYGDEDDVTFTATIGGIGSNAPTGTVTFQAGSNPLCTTSVFHRISASVYSASCSLTITQLSVGAYSVTATYSGDAHYSTSTSNPPVGFTVTKDSSSTAISVSPSTVTVGAENVAVFTVTVTTGNGEVIGAGETVTVQVGSASCVVHLTPSGQGGSGTCTIGSSALASSHSPYTVSVSYSGDANISGSTAHSASLTVNAQSGHNH